MKLLLEPEAIELLRAYGIPYPDHGLARDANKAVEIADRLGYPVVLKVVSRDLVHKSETGGVRTGLEDGQAVRDAAVQMLKDVARSVPGAEIQGLLVCQQAPVGLEVVVGSLDDDLFGPAVMFGLGGIFAEVLQDVSFRVAPLDRRDAKAMIREIRGYPLLSGARGQGEYDVRALVDLLLKVSRMAIDHPEIKEMDLNPVRLFETGLLALDARILMAS